MGNIFAILDVQFRVDFTTPEEEGGIMPWPSVPSKIIRSTLARLQQINTANGFQTDVDTTNIVPEVRGLEWAQDHSPCLMVWLGDEDAGEPDIGMVEKGIDVYIWGMVQQKDDPQTAREKLVEDIKDALYTPNRLEDPDEAGAFVCNRLDGVSVERDEGELTETGHAAFRITAQYQFPEAIQRAST